MTSKPEISGVSRDLRVNGSVTAPLSRLTKTFESRIGPLFAEDTHDGVTSPVNTRVGAVEAAQSLSAANNEGILASARSPSVTDLFIFSVIARSSRLQGNSSLFAEPVFGIAFPGVSIGMRWPHPIANCSRGPKCRRVD